MSGLALIMVLVWALAYQVRARNIVTNKNLRVYVVSWFLY